VRSGLASTQESKFLSCVNELSQTRASVVDLFCGAGGLTHGFTLEGFPIAAGIDTDEACRYAFERNNSAPFIREDVSSLDGRRIHDYFVPGFAKVLVGCAPCQPFSVYNQKNNDPKWTLLKDFARLITEIQPDVVSMENVPRLLKFREGIVFKDFVSLLQKAGYQVSWQVVFTPNYGVPQQRSRLVLLASRYGLLELQPPTYTKENYRTVKDAIGHLPSIAAGEADSADPIHRASNLSSLNMLRMKAAKPGRTWRDWPDSLIVDCHKKEQGQGYSSVYGRMLWDEPSPTITTQFYGFGNGRFGHPKQDRAISLREGSILQTFPEDYIFLPPGADIEFTKLGRMIGNAVPVELARAIARSIKLHLEEVN
jgi:DNA (cytosine-5)-methyltransferase 1